MDPVTIGMAAARLAPAVLGLFGGGGGGNRMDSKAIQRYWDEWNARIQGENLNPADYAAAGRTQTRLADAAAAAGRGQRLTAQRSYSARGLQGSPAEQTTMARAAEDEALGREKAATAASDQLYNIRLGRERQGMQEALAGFGALTGQYGRDQSRADQRQSAYFNSLLGLSKSVNDWLGGGGQRETFNDPEYNGPPAPSSGSLPPSQGGTTAY